MATILVVDDEHAVLSLVERCLCREGYEVFTATNGARAISLARRVRPDLVILDINMPGMDGLAVCHQLREDATLCTVLVLFLTERDAVEERVRGLNAGADDYLPKPFDLEELTARVRALLRRAHDGEQPAGDEPCLCVGEIVLDAASRDATVRGAHVPLTPIQFDLLACLMVHAEQVLSSEQLLQRVWGYAPGTGDSGLVRWHIMKLRDRLEGDPASPRHIKTVPGHGYMLTSSP